MNKVNFVPFVRANVALTKASPYSHHKQRACEIVEVVIDAFEFFGCKGIAGFILHILKEQDNFSGSACVPLHVS